MPRVWSLLALATGLFAFQGSTPAGAAVSVHTYTITSGTSGGSLNIGAITAGGFTVQYTSTAPCIGCAAILTQQPIVGTLGTHPALTPIDLAAWNASAYPTGYNNALVRSLVAFRPNPISTSIGTSWFYYDHALFPLSNPGVPHGRINQYILTTQQGPGTLIGTIRWSGHEVAVPEPSSSALLAAGGLMLGAYALRRARRSSG